MSHEIWAFESRIHEINTADGNGSSSGVVLGIDGGATSTTCVCMRSGIMIDNTEVYDPKSLPILGRAVGGSSNYNSVGGNFFLYLSCTVIR